MQVVIGAVIIVVLMVLAIPAAIMMGGAIWSAVMGETLTRDAEHRAADEPS